MHTAESSRDEPPADVALADLQQALFRVGRWDDLISLHEAPDDDEDAVSQALLLLAVGRAHAAELLLDKLAPDTATASIVKFLNAANAVMHGNQAALPTVISRAKDLRGHTAIDAVAMRSALTVEQRDLATHFAQLVLQKSPANAVAAATLAVEMVGQGEYCEAVTVIDRAEWLRCVDEPSALDATLNQLCADDARPRAAALATIGRFLRHHFRDRCRSRHVYSSACVGGRPGSLNWRRNSRRRRNAWTPSPNSQASAAARAAGSRSE